MTTASSRPQRFTISQGSAFEAAIGYSRAVVEGDWVFVSGTTGFDYSTMTIADDVESQCAQALRNIADALERAGSSPDHVVRVTYLTPTLVTSSRAGHSCASSSGRQRPLRPQWWSASSTRECASRSKSRRREEV